MGNSQRYEFTPEQETEIGRLVVDHWGGHITQTGFNDREIPYIYFQMSPDGEVKGFNVYPDGTSMVIRGG